MRPDHESFPGPESHRDQAGDGVPATQTQGPGWLRTQPRVAPAGKLRQPPRPYLSENKPSHTLASAILGTHFLFVENRSPRGPEQSVPPREGPGEWVWGVTGSPQTWGGAAPAPPSGALAGVQTEAGEKPQGTETSGSHSPGSRARGSAGKGAGSPPGLCGPHPLQDRVHLMMSAPQLHPISVHQPTCFILSSFTFCSNVWFGGHTLWVVVRGKPLTCLS